MLTAAVRGKLRDHQVPDEELDKLATLHTSVLSAINWQALLEWVASEGPGIISQLVVIFGGTIPVPLPEGVEAPHQGKVEFGVKEESGASVGRTRRVVFQQDTLKPPQ
jgi:hypothetical protein